MYQIKTQAVKTNNMTECVSKMSRKEIVMKKRVLGTLLTVAMLASVLQGCGKHRKDRSNLWA